ncbi:MAG: hypothetical protein A2X59_10835 [Nitrospirae bacterium GWC2_42_7]|nr:MAG: hypothetical protein A2X59_10835 [Nitrospirae bacterium GWC2_42_7]
MDTPLSLPAGRPGLRDRFLRYKQKFLEIHSSLGFIIFWFLTPLFYLKFFVLYIQAILFASEKSVNYAVSDKFMNNVGKNKKLPFIPLPQLTFEIILK